MFEKKWLKFKVTDALATLKNIDTAVLYFKDYDGSNLYLADSAIADGRLIHYYFNSSSLQALYPGFIDRASTYEWVIELTYRGDNLRVDPIAFKFSV